MDLPLGKFLPHCCLVSAIPLLFVCTLGAQANPASSDAKYGRMMECISRNRADEPEQSPISVANISFSGALQLPPSDQEEIAAEIKKRTKGNTVEDAVNEASERARAGWQDRGYFKVKVSANAQTVTSSDEARSLALFFQIEEGQRYKLSGITFKNNNAITNFGALRNLFPIRDGDIFSRAKIGTGLENLRKAYGQLGYINFTPVPDTSFDDKRRLVSLNIVFDEGIQFFIEDIRIVGVSKSKGQELLGKSYQKRGDVYNQRLWEKFLLEHYMEFNTQTFERRLDEKRGTVSLIIDARPCGAR